MRLHVWVMVVWCTLACLAPAAAEVPRRLDIWSIEGSRLANTDSSVIRGLLDVGVLPGTGDLVALSHVDDAFRVRKFDGRGAQTQEWAVPDRLQPVSALFVRGATLRLLAQNDQAEVFEVTFGTGNDPLLSKARVADILKFNERLDAPLLAALRKALAAASLTPIPRSRGALPDRETILLNYPLLTGDAYANRLAFSPDGSFFALALMSSDLLDVAWVEAGGKCTKYWRAGLRKAAGLGEDGSRLISLDVTEDHGRSVAVGLTEDSPEGFKGSVLWLEAKEGLPVVRSKSGLLAHRIPTYPSPGLRR